MRTVLAEVSMFPPGVSSGFAEARIELPLCSVALIMKSTNERNTQATTAIPR